MPRLGFGEGYVDKEGDTMERRQFLRKGLILGAGLVPGVGLAGELLGGSTQSMGTILPATADVMQMTDVEYLEWQEQMCTLLKEKQDLAGGHTYETKKIQLDGLKKSLARSWSLARRGEGMSGNMRLVWMGRIEVKEYELTLFKPDKAYMSINGRWTSTDGTHTIEEKDWEDWENMLDSESYSDTIKRRKQRYLTLLNTKDWKTV